MTDLPIEAFDALRADTTPIAPSSRFADALRRQLIASFTDPTHESSPSMTDIATPVTPAAVAAVVNTITPYLIADGAAAAIAFYVDAFGAIEDHRMVGDDGRIGHAEIVIGGSRLMLADEYPEVDAIGPISRGGSPVNFTLAVADVDRTFARAIELGATEVRPIADQFYGFRQGTVRDPFGHQWSLSQPIAGFDAQRYVDSSAEHGFVVIGAGDAAAAGGASADAAPAAHPQSKRHVPGDLYYFSLPVVDVAQAQRFFGAVLGWQFAGPESGHVENISAPPGSVGAGDDAGPRLWFVVDDIEAAMARVRAAGGVAETPVQFESGWSADCIDDQGTVFSLSVPSEAYGG